eukprot:scaffold23717_cov36-Prasinocladus_malaysianus.AAC.1
MLFAYYPKFYGQVFSVFNITAETCTVTEMDETHIITGGAWSKDESRLAVTTSDPAVHVYIVPANGYPVLEQRIGWGLCHSAAWNADGSGMAVTKWDGAIEIWEDIAAGVGDLRVILDGTDNAPVVTSVAYSADGLSVVAGLVNGQVQLKYIAGAPDKSLRLRGHTTPIRYAVSGISLLSGNRNLVASGSTEGIINVWDGDAAVNSGLVDLKVRADSFAGCLANTCLSWPLTRCAGAHFVGEARQPQRVKHSHRFDYTCLTIGMI